MNKNNPSISLAPSTNPDPCFLPNHLLFQWHITDSCNLSCSHCYQDNLHTESYSLLQFHETIDQCDELINHLNAKRSKPLHHIQCTLTGGEPFHHPHFLDMVSIIREKRPEWKIGILSNGTLITNKTAKMLSTLSIAFVQVSIDGTEHTHDTIRGKGSWRAAIEGLKLLVAAGISTQISFTASTLNYKDFPQVAKLGKQLNLLSALCRQAFFEFNRG